MTQQTIIGLYLLQAAASGFAWRFPKSLMLVELKLDLHQRRKGRIVGLEPTTSRATIWRSTTELYPPHSAIPRFTVRAGTPGRFPRQESARLEGLEPPTHGLEGRCSIQLSYRRMPKTRQYIQPDFLLTGIDYIKACQLCQHFFSQKTDPAHSFPPDPFSLTTWGLARARPAPPPGTA